MTRDLWREFACTVAECLARGSHCPQEHWNRANLQCIAANRATAETSLVPLEFLALGMAVSLVSEMPVKSPEALAFVLAARALYASARMRGARAGTPEASPQYWWTQYNA